MANLLRFVVALVVALVAVLSSSLSAATLSATSAPDLVVVVVSLVVLGAAFVLSADVAEKIVAFAASLGVPVDKLSLRDDGTPASKKGGPTYRVAGKTALSYLDPSFDRSPSILILGASHVGAKVKVPATVEELRAEAARLLADAEKMALAVETPEAKIARLTAEIAALAGSSTVPPALDSTDVPASVPPADVPPADVPASVPPADVPSPVPSPVPPADVRSRSRR